MRKLTFALLACLMAMALGACSDSEYDSMPSVIQTFISQYWPNTNVEECSYSKASAEWTIILKNGPSLVFDKAQSWVSINGNGLPLPQTLLYDRLPSVLYDYLESGEYLGQVFIMERDNFQYTLQLLDSKLYYDIDTHTVTGNDPSTEK